MLGLSKDQKLGLDLKNVAPEYKKLTEAILSNKKEHVVNMDDAGATVYYIIKDSAKSLQGCSLVIIRDITHQRQIEQELVNARNKAEESDRLKSAFLANMSHEIRTPMNTILGFVSLLQESEHEEKEQTEYLQIVRESSERLLNTLSDIIDLSKVEAGFTTPTFSDFDVQDLFMNLYIMQKKAADDKQLLFIRQWNVPSEFLYIHSDKEKVFSIATNLVNNAIKYTNQGFVEFRCQVTREQLDITVKDTGIGIPVEMQQSIFERFMQVDTSHQRLYEGAGLGLSITKAYVDMLGGTIDVESELGKGSVFHVSLPISIADVFLHDA
jgi:signal transduction histidine kinase